MSDWKITGKSPSDNIGDAAMEIATGGLCSRPTEYEITNEKTGDVKHSSAYNEKQLDENIRNGRLRD
jgi:hypothetical protein